MTPRIAAYRRLVNIQEHTQTPGRANPASQTQAFSRELPFGDALYEMHDVRVPLEHQVSASHRWQGHGRQILWGDESVRRMRGVNAKSFTEELCLRAATDCMDMSGRQIV